MPSHWMHEDVADLIEGLTPHEIVNVLDALDREHAARAIEHLSSTVQTELVGTLLSTSCRRRADRHRRANFVATLTYGGGVQAPGQVNQLAHVAQVAHAFRD